MRILGSELASTSARRPRTLGAIVARWSTDWLVAGTIRISRPWMEGMHAYMMAGCVLRHELYCYSLPL
jgi:hypothetical protein